MVAKRLLLALVVCSLGIAAPAKAQSKSRDLITREDIEKSPQKDLDIYQVIRSLRPHMLAPPRGVRTLGNAATKMGIYIDGTHELDFDVLKDISASSVLEVRYLEPAKAANEYGNDASGGALVIKRIKNVSPPKIPADTAKPAPI